jgi:hypothetical protein
MFESRQVEHAVFINLLGLALLREVAWRRDEEHRIRFQHGQLRRHGRDVSWAGCIGMHNSKKARAAHAPRLPWPPLPLHCLPAH